MNGSRYSVNDSRNSTSRLSDHDSSYSFISSFNLHQSFVIFIYPVRSSTSIYSYLQDDTFQLHPLSTKSSFRWYILFPAKRKKKKKEKRKKRKKKNGRETRVKKNERSGAQRRNFSACKSFACSNLERVSEYTSGGKRIPGPGHREDAVAMQDT